jgi:hypothetical protein
MPSGTVNVNASGTVALPLCAAPAPVDDQA